MTLPVAQPSTKLSVKWAGLVLLITLCSLNTTARPNQSAPAFFADSLIKSILDRYHLTGTILIHSQQKNLDIGYNPSRWDSGYLPASTFKIPNSIIGLESGIVDTNYIFRWNGESRRMKQWEQDMNLVTAFHLSCVPCYQELARKTGAARMRSMVEKIGYPGMDVHNDNIDLFWLEGASRITPRQQVQFIQRLCNEEIPVSKEVLRIMKRVMDMGFINGYHLFAKTGWAIRNGNNYGWFVGYMEKGDCTAYFATLVEPIDQADTGDFAASRKSVTIEVIENLFDYICTR